MKKIIALSIFLFCIIVFAVSATAGSVYVYKKPKVKHSGKEATPLEAYEMIRKDPTSMIIVDVRSRAEYQFVGHPENAYLVPAQFLDITFSGKEYAMKDNPNFTKDIMARFDPTMHTLFFICRSGTRAAMALNRIVQAGWPADRVYVILGGFEGGKLKDKNSAYNGIRKGGGWRNEGLPWTYAIDSKLAY